jgi:hypothetical protein
VAKSFIHYHEIKGALYASVYTPARINGKKDNQPLYLGRVINKEQGLYRSRERGMFKYSLTDGFSEIESVFQYQKEEKLILDFGDAYVLRTILQLHGYWDLFRSILPGREDTLCTLLFYRILRGGASRYAYDWWEGSYLRQVCSDVKIESQRVSEFFVALGKESVQRDFFPKYLAKISEGQKNHGILIDSTGMPNDCCSPLTAINNHNGVISNETRLILVVDRVTKMPLLYRYNAGNIVDVSTLKATILELETYGVSIDFSILDAGYYSEKNVKALYAARIRFITRLSSNLKLYKELVKSHAGTLESQDNAVFYRERLLYIIRVPIQLCGHDAYAYVAIDHQRRADEMYTFMRRQTENKGKLSSADKLDYQLKSKGMFIIISSECVEISEILPLYYTRQVIEQVFDFYKNNADLLPLRTHSEETLRGHLMLSFMSTIAYMLINNLLDGTKFCGDGAFRALHNLKCKVFDDQILVKEPNKKINDIAKHLKIEIPLKF